MICFHFTIFVVLETTLQTFAGFSHWLWFAFILLSLSYWKQLRQRADSAKLCCDLLSFYYLCRTGNNFVNVLNLRSCVVICFHFTIFVVLETTRGRCAPPACTLWFAFILLSLSYWKQQGDSCPPVPFGCDLLSFYYLCRTGNNYLSCAIHSHALWFAFILLSLSYWKQRLRGG